MRDSLFLQWGEKTMRARLLVGLVLLSALGCGAGKRIVPVSGTVTLNGKPLAKATVSFQPIAPPGTMDAGVGSQAKTNDQGEFTLTTATGQNGAVVGKHRIIITLLSEQVGDSDARPPRGGWPMADQVPKRYNSESQETFDVPAGGTKKADFALTSP
jgi:hypothetical protein